MNKLIVTIFLSLFFCAAHAQEIPQDAARVSWSEPTQRVDETPLSPDEIQGYELFWGMQSDSLTEMIFVPAGTNQYMVTQLSEGEWFFAVKTVDTNDLRSDFSSTVSKIIQIQSEQFPEDPNRIGIR